MPKNEELDESVKVEGGPPKDGGPGSGAHNHDNKSSSRFDKVSNVKSFGKNLKGVTGVTQDGSRLEFDSNDGTTTAREILKKFGKGKVKVTSIPDEDDEEGMRATVVVTPVNEELDTDDTSLVKKVANMLKKASKKHASQSKMLDKAVNESVSKALLNKDGKPSIGKLKNAIDDVNNSRSMAGDKYGITNIDYREKNGKKFLDVEVEDEKGLLKALQAKYGKSVKLRGYSDFYIEELQEADLTDKQVKMVRKVADKLPKDDFKKRYGKDADNVKFGTATNIVKKKLKIDEYEGARTLVDRLLKQERGDE